MIRLTFLWLVILGILGYTWKDWYRGTCGLIVMMAVIEHPDMPKSILGIPGLNPWNLLLLNAVLAWMAQRKKEGLRWDLPASIATLLVLYLIVVLIGFVRIIGDTTILTLYYREGMTYFLNEYVVNTVKWVIPGLLLYDGCRTEERFRLAVVSILAVFVLLGIQVAKWMPPQFALDADALERRSIKVLIRGIGYHRVNLSAMLSGASWAILCTTVLVPRGKRWLVLLAALFVVYAQMMTGGRAGYGAWVAVGIVMCVLKWRRYLMLIPTAALVAFLLLPGVVGRALQGFTEDSHDTNTRLEQQEARVQVGGDRSSIDSYTVTAGRSLAWPLIIEEIRKRPFTGYGRQAMLRSGVAVYLYETLGEVFPHPHNAYLEIVFDNGIFGAAIVLSFYVLMLAYSIRLFRDSESPSCSAIGGVSTALMLGLLVSSLGSQTFYPREGWVGMWAAMFLVLRVRIERQRQVAAQTIGQVRQNRPLLLGQPSGVTPPLLPLHARTRGARVPVTASSRLGPITPAPRRARTQPSTSQGRRSVSVAEAPNTAPALPVTPAPRRLRAPLSAPSSDRSGSAIRGRSSARRLTGIAHSGFFGSTVIDPLVWERA